MGAEVRDSQHLCSGLMLSDKLLQDRATRFKATVFATRVLAQHQTDPTCNANVSKTLRMAITVQKAAP